MKAFIPHVLVIPFLLYEIFQHEMAEAIVVLFILTPGMICNPRALAPAAREALRV